MDKGLDISKIGDMIKPLLANPATIGFLCIITGLLLAKSRRVITVEEATGLEVLPQQPYIAPPSDVVTQDIYLTFPELAKPTVPAPPRWKGLLPDFPGRQKPIIPGAPVIPSIPSAPSTPAKTKTVTLPGLDYQLDVFPFTIPGFIPKEFGQVWLGDLLIGVGLGTIIGSAAGAIIDKLPGLLGKIGG